VHGGQKVLRSAGEDHKIPRIQEIGPSGGLGISGLRAAGWEGAKRKFEIGAVQQPDNLGGPAV
jgi:hypothetical protein